MMWFWLTLVTAGIGACIFGFTRHVPIQGFKLGAGAKVVISPTIYRFGIRAPIIWFSSTLAIAIIPNMATGVNFSQPLLQAADESRE